MKNSNETERIFKKEWCKPYSLWMRVYLWFRRVFKKEEVIVGVDLADGEDYSCMVYWQEHNGTFYLLKTKYEKTNSK